MSKPNLPLGEMSDGSEDPRCLHPDFGRRFGELQGDTPATEIAQAVGISPEIVRAYRRGHAVPSATTREKLERYFGVTLDAQETRAPQLEITMELQPDGNMRMVIEGPQSLFKGLTLH